jgi:diaminohydroxyphosphoribosylaminopyrimidine deaminase/5-amino-6-(5-phosphoribosylamino)uracil reductase
LLLFIRITYSQKEYEVTQTQSLIVNQDDVQHIDQIHLHQALELAKIRRGFCAPNPSVGCVIISQAGELIATGYHLEQGAAHAEVAALNNLKDSSQIFAATVYVTLEPCCHVGATPPCTDALIKAGVKRVVYGYRDPNPVVFGKGELALQAAGIQCDYLAIPEIQAFYTSYQHWQTHKMPFVTAKIAMTLNGMIAGTNNSRIQITGEALQEFTHYLRKHSDAILTTAKTILHDNPKLNARYENEIFKKAIYVLDSQLSTSLSAEIFSTAKAVTFFHGDQVDIKNHQELVKKGVRCIEVERTHYGLSLPQVLNQIGADGVHDLWVEAGGKLFNSLMSDQLLQRAFIYIAPTWLTEGISAFSSDFSFATCTQQVHWEQMGTDVLCEIHW